MKYNYLHIALESYQLNFELIPTPITELWIERMERALPNYPLDNPDRFYGFNGRDAEVKFALDHINKQINIINSYEFVVERHLTCIDDQDTLNYLHNIFEKYHGLLDQQDHLYWQDAPHEVRRALSELNIAVHRCESVYRNCAPRFVCTWFGLPKGPQLSEQLITEYGELGYRWGGVYLNYVEIGKTFEDLEIDNDNYIGDDAFKPFVHYSADFSVRFEDNKDAIPVKLERLEKYFNQHRDFFTSRGHSTFNDVWLMPYKYRVAQLVETQSRMDILKNIAKQQHIERVYFS